MNIDLKLIKKYYGEDMMHFARDNFSTILDNPGKLSKIFLDNFACSKYLYENLNSVDELTGFKNFIYNIYNNNEYTTKLKTDKTPSELLSIAGYNLYECKNENDIQSFKKYYAKGEELCTFKGKRLDRCYVFFAVKKNVDKIRRKDFKNPKREDEYGTSVISIQFSKDNTHSLSIKNRYNHTVKDCDSTFKNNLDNIISGLTYSFEKYYGMKQEYINKEDFAGFVRANDGKYYKFNSEKNGIHFCQDNVLVEYGTPKKLDKEKYIILDTNVLDLQNKTFINFNYDDDCFKDTIGNIIKIKIEKQSNGNKLIIIKTDKEDVIIEINKYGEIMGYINNNIEDIGNNFMRYNISLQYLVMDNVKNIGDSFLFHNDNLKTYKLDKVESIGNDFMRYSNSKLKNLNFPKLKNIGDYFFPYLDSVETINLPEILCLSDHFLLNSRANISNFNIPKCKIIGNNVLTYANIYLNNANFDSLESVGDLFLSFSSCENDTLNMPKVKSIGNNVLSYEQKLKYINLPNLISLGKNFLHLNAQTKELNVNNLISLSENCFSCYIIQNVKNYKMLSNNELVDAIKVKALKRNRLKELKKLKKQIIQTLYKKKKILKK